jgi:PilZ domain
MRRAASAGVGVPPEAVLGTIRIPFIQRASVLHRGKEQGVFLVDLGMRGAFAETPNPLPAGDEVELRFPLPGNEIPVVARCRVAWRHLPDESPAGFPTGMGLAFVEMPPADRARIRAHLAEHCRTARGRRFARRWPDGGDDEAP